MLKKSVLFAILSGCFWPGPTVVMAEPQDLGFFGKDSAKTIFEGEDSAPEVYSPEKQRTGRSSENIGKPQGWDPGQANRGEGKDTAAWSAGQDSAPEESGAAPETVDAEDNGVADTF